MVALRAEDVSKRVKDGAGTRTVLEGIQFQVAHGELAVVRGPSGSGKTTLLGVLGALLSPTRGEVFVEGEPTSRLREWYRAEVRRKRIGFVFQDLQLIDSMTVVENVLLPRVPDGIEPSHRTRAAELLARFGLVGREQSPARSLSGGERQRVAIARALLQDPRILLLDEPTSHLDAANADQILAVLEELVRDGRALVVATHDPRLLGSQAISRVHTLAGGQLVDGP